MPRKAKDKEEIIEEKKVKKTAATKKTSTKKAPAKKASTSKKATTKKATVKKENKSTTSSKKKAEKKTVAKKKEVKPKKETKNKTKASTTSKTKAKPKASTTVKKEKKVTPKKSSRTTKTSKKIEVVEYYDLPYRYNKTIVKVLAQTPNTLFVYWDISDSDKENYINKYGEFFFNDTKPVLIVHNLTLNYDFEVDINDFANSWYLHIDDANCDYTVELGRRPINEYAKIDNYLPIYSSNEMDAPNDHILFDTFNKIVYFRNVKTNVENKKDISLSFLTKIGKLYNIKEFYKKLYKDENIDFEKLNLKNMPSS